MFCVICLEEDKAVNRGSLKNLNAVEDASTNGKGFVCPTCKKAFDDTKDPLLIAEWKDAIEKINQDGGKDEWAWWLIGDALQESNRLDAQRDAEKAAMQAFIKDGVDSGVIKIMVDYPKAKNVEGRRKGTRNVNHNIKTTKLLQIFDDFSAKNMRVNFTNLGAEVGFSDKTARNIIKEKRADVYARWYARG